MGGGTKGEYIQGAHQHPDAESSADGRRLSRFLDLFGLDTKRLHQQTRYKSKAEKGPFGVAGKGRLTELAARHFDRSAEFWLGSRCARNRDEHFLRFLLLDFDNDGIEGGRERAWTRVCLFVTAIGADVIPLVFTTPGGGYHVIYFLEAPVRLFDIVDERAPQSGGPLHEIARSLFHGDSGQGTFEVFPQAGVIVRWPFGNRQDLVDLETGVPIGERSVDELLDIAEHHRASANLLTLERILEVRAALRSTVGIIPEVEQHVSCSNSPQSTSTRIHKSALASAQEAYRDGLLKPCTRHRTMYAIARVMVHHPSALEPFGYTADHDPAEQLVEWLRVKHSGNSKEYAAGPNPDYWLRRCAGYVADARGGYPVVDRSGKSLLAALEWDQVFGLSKTDAFPRHRLELVATWWLWKAKSVVLYTGTPPDSDGTFAAEIQRRWLRQIKFATSSRQVTAFREALVSAGLFRIGRSASKLERRATTYVGFRLDIMSALGGSAPPELKALHEHFGLQEMVTLHYCTEVVRRFGEAALRARYGRAGREYILDRLERARVAAAELGFVFGEQTTSAA